MGGKIVNNFLKPNMNCDKEKADPGRSSAPLIKYTM